MAGLPHFDKAQASKNLFEPAYTNLFEVTFLPPAGVDGSLMLEHVNGVVSGLDALNPVLNPIIQKYKTSDRSYLGMPEQTFVDIAISFSLNLNDANQLYIYKEVQKWYKKGYDPLTGEQGLKKDYVGTIIIVDHNRPGDVYRKITLFDAFIAPGPTGLDARDYTSSEAQVLEVTFRCDHWDEELT